jgi:hypothetical protein
MQKTTEVTSVTKRGKSPVRNPGPGSSGASRQNPVEASSRLQRFETWKADYLFWSLPKNLALVIGRNPTDAIKADSVSHNPSDGFNVIMWKNGADFKLYLENRDSGGAINPKTQITYADVQDLAQKVDPKSKRPLPTTIVIKTRNFGPSMWDAKKMALDLLGTYRAIFTPGNNFSVLLKGGKVQNVPNGTVTIEFSVKSRASIEPIMTPEAFNSDVKKKQAVANVPALLEAYQQMLRKGVQNFRRVEAQEGFQTITAAANSLKQALGDLIRNKSGLFANKDELPALEKLQAQVTSAIADGFKNELDTMRWQEWNKHTPFTEDQIVPGTEQLVGAGAQGNVNRYSLKVETGSDFVAVVKFEDTGLGLNNPARAAGIPEENPQQSLRAVAAYQISRRMLALDIIPRTDFFVGTDDNTGRPKLGQAMGFVNGSVGQRKVALMDGNPLSADDFASLGLTDDINRYNIPASSQEDKRQVLMKFGGKDITKIGNEWYKKPYPVAAQAGLAQRLDSFQAILQDPNSDASDKDGARNALNSYVKKDGRWYNAAYLPPDDVNYNDPAVQKGLSDLQLFDFIIGHADRNPGNWIFEKNATGGVIGVKGIDNDDTFGQNWSLPISKTPGIPPIVDFATAQSILKTNAVDIRPLLAGLSDEEIDNAVARFVWVKQVVQQRLDDGHFASLDNIPGARKWGGEQMAAVHTAENSYLGVHIAGLVRGEALKLAEQLA